MNFNQPEEEFLDGDDVVGLGVLGKEGSGRLRAQVSLFSFLPLNIDPIDKFHKLISVKAHLLIE